MTNSIHCVSCFFLSLSSLPASCVIPMEVKRNNEFEYYIQDRQRHTYDKGKNNEKGGTRSTSSTLGRPRCARGILGSNAFGVGCLGHAVHRPADIFHSVVPLRVCIDAALPLPPPAQACAHTPHPILARYSQSTPRPIVARPQSPIVIPSPPLRVQAIPPTPEVLDELLHRVVHHVLRHPRCSCATDPPLNSGRPIYR